MQSGSKYLLRNLLQYNIVYFCIIFSHIQLCILSLVGRTWTSRATSWTAAIAGARRSRRRPATRSTTRPTRRRSSMRSSPPEPCARPRDTPPAHTTTCTTSTVTRRRSSRTSASQPFALCLYWVIHIWFRSCWSSFIILIIIKITSIIVEADTW